MGSELTDIIASFTVSSACASRRAYEHFELDTPDLEALVAARAHSADVELAVAEMWRRSEERWERDSERAARRIETSAEVEVLDVTDPAQTECVISRVLARGPVDVLVNNAGYSVTGAAEEMTDEQVQHQIDTLLLAPMRITRRLLAAMRENGRGWIIQISSVGGQVVYPAASAYHAGKWGLEGFTEALQTEVAEFGIRCTIIEPGSTRTDFSASMRYADTLPAYEQGAVADMREYIRGADDTVYTEDPRKLAHVIVDLTRQDDPPLRLPLGADAHIGVTKALRKRLEGIAPLADLAASVAFSSTGAE